MTPNITSGTSEYEKTSMCQREVDSLRRERSDLSDWFEHHHVTGTFTLEEIDAMSPRQMADHCYERKADEVEALRGALQKAKRALEGAPDFLTQSQMKAGALFAIKDCGL